MPVFSRRESMAALGAMALTAAWPFPEAALAQGTQASGAQGRVTSWLDAERTVHDAHQARHATIVLVRPDWYIGYRAEPADGDALVAYLDRYLFRAGNCCELGASADACQYTATSSVAN